MILPHNAVYNASYYRKTIEHASVASAPRIAKSILRDLKPNSIVDVGCGTGALLETLRDAGCNVLGLEYSDVALEYCNSRQLSVMKFDLRKDNLEEPHQFDVAVSMEVAEHLPEAYADKYIGLLSRLSSTIVFTAAQPGQGGTDHVNEQPWSYWISRFAANGFELDQQLSEHWRNEWRQTKSVRRWYSRNLLVFRARNVGQ